VNSRTCTIICRDLKDVEHAVEVTADSVDEAVARGLRIFRSNDWVGDIAHGRNTVTTIVRQPEVKHIVEIDEFEKWLREPSVRSPAEMSPRSRAPEVLGIKD
jgi:hypothetical protein